VAQVLVLAERGTAAALLTAARRYGTPAAVLPGPADPASVALLARFGAAVIYPVDAPELVAYPAAARVEVLVALARDTAPARILVAAGRLGQEVAARVAVRLESRLVETVHIGAIRSQPAPVHPAVRPVRVAFPPGVRAVRRVPCAPGPPPLASAAVIVAGGYGVGSPDGFALVRRVAEALGGAVGASRTATELGWCPREARVDQIGTVVHPSLYLALGISGSVRHRAGMRGAGTVVAVDRDPAAPIFQVADLGVVGDLHAVGPELLAEIRRRRATPPTTSEEPC
jgi:electron transfer flavoprotein alpha subunit